MKKPAATLQNVEVLRSKALIVYERLTELYGERPLIPRREPMHELISTILSQRTNHRNESAAYRQMWERFSSWEAIRDAPVEELTEAIAPSNYAETKAPNIQKTLAHIINERGEVSIEFLRDLPPDAGLSWLMSLPSVGIKTASLVLLFCFSKPVMPVDTHVHRVSQRVGLIGPKVTPPAAHEILLEILPAEPYFLYNFHIALLRHGQQTCVWSNPRCEQCPLTDICEWFQEHKARTK
jgi:endonuclease III